MPIDRNKLNNNKALASFRINRDQIEKAAVICISHKEDVDGIASAALIKAVNDPKTVIMLVDYVDIMENLHYVSDVLSEEKTKIGRELYICDLAISKKDWSDFIGITSHIIWSLGHKVVYIDHHFLAREKKLILASVGITLIHSTEECASVLTYQIFRPNLQPSASFLAASAAMMDCMENKPLATSIISQFDRQFLMFESTILSYAIASSQSDPQYLYGIVDMLSKMKYPHQIRGVLTAAQSYLNRISDVISVICNSILEKHNIAYVYISDDILVSTIVNFVLGMSKKPVVIAYNQIDNTNLSLLAIRGSEYCNVHLGKIVNDIASRINGSGGGHEKDCGAIIPRDKIEEFLNHLDMEIR